MTSPSLQGEVHFEYDPARLLPTEGGAVWEFPRAASSRGRLVTSGNRPDVLVFRSFASSGGALLLGTCVNNPFRRQYRSFDGFHGKTCG